LSILPVDKSEDKFTVKAPSLFSLPYPVISLEPGENRLLL